jgi:hypothetical protein
MANPLSDDLRERVCQAVAWGLKGPSGGEGIQCQPGQRGQQAIEAAGARLLYLPPYSPDLNPMEMTLAKFKALLRAAAARTVDAL